MFWQKKKNEAPQYSGVTPALVKLCYQLILNREPESREVIDDKVAHARDFESLLRSFVESPEFKDKLATLTALHDLSGSRQRQIDVDVDSAVLERLFLRTQDQWEKLGQKEPFWSVITHDIYRAEKLDESARKKFYDTGRDSADLIECFESRTGVPANRGTCIELGSGTGRVTRWLAAKFDRVLALDISPGNLKICEDMARALGLANIECQLVNGFDVFEGLGEYDFFFSTIVLMHNPPPVQRFILDEMLARLRVGGEFLFQLQTHDFDLQSRDNWYHFDAEAYLESPVETMDMHVLPMRYVFELFSKHGVKPKEVLMDTWTGHIGSHTFFGTK